MTIRSAKTEPRSKKSPSKDDVEDVRTAVRLLRALRNWDQKQLAAALGVDKSRVSLWERGLVPLREDDLRRIAEAAGLSRGLFGRLVTVARLFRPLLAPGTAERLGSERLEEAFSAADRLGASMAATIQIAATELLINLEASAEQEEARKDAERLLPERAETVWQRLQDCPSEHWELLARCGREYQAPAMALRFCAESEAAEAGDPERAEDAARAALAAAWGAGQPRHTDPEAIKARCRELAGPGGTTPARLRELARGLLEERARNGDGQSIGL
jgi:transcriptional regulator with XRE-family HTH domain